MKCNEVSSLLVDFLYEEMPAAERRDFLAHVDGCASCSAEVKAMTSTLEHARAALRGPLAEEPPPHVRARILQAAEAATTAKVVETSRVGSPPASPALRVAHHRGRVWEPFQGSHFNEGFFSRLWKTPWLVPALGAAGVATAVFLVKVIKNPQVFPEPKPAVTETLIQPAAAPPGLQKAPQQPETEPAPLTAPTAPAPAKQGLAVRADKPTARSGEASYSEMKHAKKTAPGGLRPAARALDNLATTGRRSYDGLLDKPGGAWTQVPAGEATVVKGGVKVTPPGNAPADVKARRAPAPAMHANKDEASPDDLLRALPEGKKAPVAEGAGSSGRWAKPPPPRAAQAPVAPAPAPVTSAAAPAATRPAPPDEAKALEELNDRLPSPVAEEPPRSAAPAKMQKPVRSARADHAAQAEAQAEKRKPSESKETLSFEERVRKAEKIFAEKKWAEAAAAFRALIAQAPANPAVKTWRERVAAAELAQEQARSAKAKKAATSNDALDGF